MPNRNTKKPAKKQRKQQQQQQQNPTKKNQMSLRKIVAKMQEEERHWRQAHRSSQITPSLLSLKICPLSLSLSLVCVCLWTFLSDALFVSKKRLNIGFFALLTGPASCIWNRSSRSTDEPSIHPPTYLPTHPIELSNLPGGS
jgi:hypothetical protein